MLVENVNFRLVRSKWVITSLQIGKIIEDVAKPRKNFFFLILIKTSR